MAKSHKGQFKPRNPQKYKGNPTTIIWRSSWELQVMLEFDKNDAILEWSSEQRIIPYKNPITGRLHRYFPDFYVKQRTKEGIIEELIIEVKPMHEVMKPKPTKDRKVMQRKQATYIKNRAKWEAAKRYCEQRKYKFIVMTKNEAQEKFILLNEKQLGLGNVG